MNDLTLLLVWLVSLAAVTLPKPAAIYAQPADAPMEPPAPVGGAHVSRLFDAAGPSGGPGIWL